MFAFSIISECLIHLLILAIIELSKYGQLGWAKTLVFSYVFLQPNVWLSIVSCVYWPSEFLFLSSPFMFLTSVDPCLDDLCFSLRQENVLWLLPQLSPPAVFWLSPASRHLDLFLYHFIFILYVPSVGFYSVLKEMFFNVIFPHSACV